jgi:hypothetical protein
LLLLLLLLLVLVFQVATMALDSVLTLAILLTDGLRFILLEGNIGVSESLLTNVDVDVTDSGAFGLSLIIVEVATTFWV